MAETQMADGELSAMRLLLAQLLDMQREHHAENRAAINENRTAIAAVLARADAQGAKLTVLETRIDMLNLIVERIRRPVDSFISLRNALIGVGAVVTAVGAVVSAAWYALPHLIAGWQPR